MSDPRNKQSNRQEGPFAWTADLALPLIISLIMAIALFVMKPVAGILAFIGAGFIGFYTFYLWKEARKEALEAQERLNEDFDEVTKNAVFGMPFPMILLDEEGHFLWYNSIFKEIFSLEESLLGQPLTRVFDRWDYHLLLDDTTAPLAYRMDGKTWLFHHNTTQSRHGQLILLYGIDNSDNEAVHQAYLDNRLAVGLVFFDNYEEVRSKTNEWDRSLVFAQVDGIVHKYASYHQALYIKYESDRYLMVMTQAQLDRAMEDKFALLEEVKALKEQAPIAPTLSIGLAYTVGEESPGDLLKSAHQALDIALSRGGDQAVLRGGDQLTYYGGQTQATQRYTKVKARVMANTLKGMIQEASNVLVMGHQNADMDSYGSSLGMLTLVQALGKSGWFVLDEVTPAIQNLHQMALKELEGLDERILTPDKAKDHLYPGSLVIVLDNHRHDSTAAPALLDQGNPIVIIDHHRRGADYIASAELAYIEPNASSASELVTELFNFMGDIEMPQAVAEGLLAGIMVDTKNFFYQTGIRTFEAAAYLKQFGANSIVVKSLFKDDFSLTQARSEVISNAEPFEHRTIIGHFNHDREGASLIASEAADELLGIRGVDASFVLAPAGGRIHISARSLGSVSVQLIMEKLGGGGHLTSAAVQLDVSMEEADGMLRQAIHEYFAEEKKDEGHFA